jgi:tRNA-dihydrouridine synthase
MWRYVVFRLERQAERSHSKVVVAIGEVDKADHVQPIAQHYAPDAVMYPHGALNQVWGSQSYLYGTEVFARGTNGFDDLERVTIGARLEDVWGYT